jgi:hypothetical protein
MYWRQELPPPRTSYTISLFIYLANLRTLEGQLNSEDSRKLVEVYYLLMEPG